MGSVVMEFLLGCNYWASNAGVDMWNQWDAQRVEEDFRILKENNVNTLRMFINWRDFQPVTTLYDCGNVVKEYVMPDLKKPKNPYYLDEVMLERFDVFCDLAEKYGFKLIVGIVTGWMSGRMYTPPALEGKNTFTDPLSLRFQIKLVTGIVSRFKNKKAIYAWNLGNECNCMSHCETSDAAYSWTALIANTIHAYDPSRMVISGMHGLSVANASWLIEDQGEATDMLTTHPYAYFVKHCSVDPLNSIRALMHGTCETLLYAQISHKPCLVEELGTLSHSVCSDEVSADFMRINLLSNWAQGAQGVLWWCAHEQSHLENPPYNWCMLERELGLLDKDYQPKKYFLEMKEFARFLKDTGLQHQRPETDAAILLTQSIDHWGIGYMSFILAKQAGLEPEFVAPNTEIPEKDVYIMPSTRGVGCLYKEYYFELKKRVANGATLYVSNSDAYFSELTEFFGIEIRCIEQQTGISGEFALNGDKIPYAYGLRRLVTAKGAEVIAEDTFGNPLFTAFQYGKGKVIFLNFPMEEEMLTESYAFHKNRHKVYEYAFKAHLETKKVLAKHAQATVTIAGNTVTVLNLSNEEIDPEIVWNGAKVDQVYRGKLDKIPPCDGCIFTIKQ